MKHEGDYGDDDLGRKVLVDYPLTVTRQHNENFMGVFVGMPGRGKTWAAVRLAEQIDPTFHIGRVCVTYEEFLNVLEGIAQEWDEGLDVAGSVVVFDEFQKTAGARKFMSHINQAINDVLHTFRYLNLIVFFTTPHLSFIDINSRAVMHFIVVMKEKIKSVGMTRAELNFSEIKNNPHDPSDKLYHFAPRLFTSEGAFRVKFVFFRKPSKGLARAVDDKINQFKHRVLLEAMANNEKAKEEVKKEKTPAERMRELANEIFVNRQRYFDERRNKWDIGGLMLDYPEVTKSKFSGMKPLLEAMIERGVKARDLDIPE